jgi:hypothetical protein
VYDADKGIIKMRQDRFGYTYEQAAAMIGSTNYANKLSSTQQAILSPAQARAIYLLKLDGPHATPAKVQIAANLPAVPELYQGTSDEGGSLFCKIDDRTKLAIENWLSTQRGLSLDLFSSLSEQHTRNYPLTHFTLSWAKTLHSHNLDHKMRNSSRQSRHLVEHKINTRFGISSTIIS